MVGPYRDATVSKAFPNGKGLIFTGPLEAFTTRIKVAAYGGLVIASPVVFFHLWRFITPGLNPKEKRYAIPFTVSSVILFAGGSVVAGFSFPHTLPLFLHVGRGDPLPLVSAAASLNPCLPLLFVPAQA